MIGDSKFQKDLRFAQLLVSRLSIARRYIQNMMYQNIHITYLVVKVLSLFDGAPEWNQGKHWPLPLKIKSVIG